MPRKPKGFRIARKKIGLTYSCPKDAAMHPISAHKELRDFMESKGYCKYLIGREQHTDKSPTSDGLDHWHVYVHYDTIIDTSDSRFFDLNGVHPNILSGAPGQGWITYCAKCGDIDTNFYQKNPYAMALQQPTAEAALESLWASNPEDMCKFGSSISENVTKRMRTTPPQLRYYGPYPKHFYPPAWDPKTHSLLLIGPPGIGKTQFARYLLGANDYVKGRLDPGLRGISFDKPLIFDEINMLDSPPEQSKEITDVENGGTISMRYKNPVVPPGIPRIFCANMEYPFRNPNDAVYGRRVVTHSLYEPFVSTQFD